MGSQTKAASFVRPSKNVYDFSYALTVIVTLVGGAMVLVGTALTLWALYSLSYGWAFINMPNWFTNIGFDYLTQLSKNPSQISSFEIPPIIRLTIAGLVIIMLAQSAKAIIDMARNVQARQ